MRAYQKEYLKRPGKIEKQRAAVAKSRKRPEAMEAHRKRQLIYSKKHRARENARALKWRRDNCEYVKAFARARYLKNKAEIIAAAREHRHANREAYRQYQRSYKARKRAGGGRLSRGWIATLFVKQDGLCAACDGRLAALGYHLDHITPISKGGPHSDVNTQLLCPTCNIRKSDGDFEAFLELLRAENAVNN